MQKEYKLLIDNREHNKRISNIQDRLTKTTILNEVTVVPVGDYIGMCDENILFSIEWKSFDDLVSSIRNGHLSSQLIDMEQFNCPYLFVIGNYWTWKKKHSHMTGSFSYSNYIGYLVSATARHKTKIIVFENDAEAIDAIVHLFKIYSGCEADASCKMPERVRRTGDKQSDMFLMLPGVGPKKYNAWKDKITYLTFLRVCQMDNAAKVFMNEYNIKVPNSVIDYCKGL